jgi:hypothetical protein
MVFEIYINAFKDFLLKCIDAVNMQRVVFYTVYMIYYFFLYFTLSIPKLFKDNNENPLFVYANSIKDNKANIITLLIFDAIFIISYIASIVYYYRNKDIITEYGQFKIIILIIICSTILIFFNILIYAVELQVVSDWKWTQPIFNVTSTIFYYIFIILFFYNIESGFNIEFSISILILLLYLSEYILFFTNGVNQLYNRLLHDNFSTMTVNCFSNITNETFDSSNSQSQQLIDIQNIHGPNYLKTIGNIPISFINSKTNDYQDLILADFYYPGSFYSYLADSPLSGTPNLEALRIVLEDYNTRFIHLDIFSSNTSDPYDTSAEPVIRCDAMNINGSPLSIIDTFNLISKWAWIHTDSNNMSYPLFLYLNFNFDDSNENLYLKIYRYLIKFFSKYFVDKKYSFCGRNSSFLISMAKMKECLGKIIIVTNRYPTKCALDELINAAASMSNKANSINNCFNLLEYKESYIKYDKLGLSQDYDKTTILNNSRTNITFFYTLPNSKYTTTAERKSGLYNSSFQDCAQYGIQGTLMYIFLPDDNLNKWNAFFKNKNNLNPVLKDESLRYIEIINPPPVEQNPVIGLQQPQTYTLIPGMLTTEKSNLSVSVTNKSNN